MSNISPQKRSKPRVAVLLCTVDHCPFLEEQLQSIRDQSSVDVEVWLSHDEESDESLQNIRRRVEKIISSDKLHVLKGPRQGFAQNFLSLLCHSINDSPLHISSYYSWILNISG